ncbi:MAG: hypothetical protein Ct9H300mP31_03320 [Acidimicrobiaceae bacterium]|nr:MAG: hypothetical protein Ct9H300mP31_03320 [Acidimicrobiaceae bacterium]
MTLLYWQAASTLNPYLSGGWKDRDAGSVILEPLAEFDDQGVLVPALATEIPTVANGGVAEDLKSITWQLLEGVLWSDGTPLTSDDVVFSWEYCSHPDTGCANAGSYEGVTSVEAVDDLTITVNFAEATPFPYVPFVSNSLPVIQRAQFGNCVGAASAECTDQNFAPIGTGPFKIESFTTNDTAVYVINENYRGVPEGKPYFGRVVIKGGGDAPATARSVLELGESDYAWNLQVEPEILAAMVAAGKGTVVSAFSTMVERIMVNQTNPDPALGDDRSEYMDGGNPHPFLTDPVVGRALSIAIDRQTLVDVGYGDAGRPTCNVWPAPPAQNSTANDECLTQDIDLANQLLDDAGYADTDGDGVRESPDGVPLKILYQTSTNTVRQATQELIKQDWAKIGVETELRNIDASVFFGGDPASPDTYGKFYADIEMYTNGAAGVDSQSYMGSWTTPNISGKDTNWQGSNVQRFQSDEYDTLHAELTQTADMDRRNEITIQLNDLVVGNYSIIPLIHRGSVSAHANSLTGVKLNPWDAELWNIGDWARGTADPEPAPEPEEVSSGAGEGGTVTLLYWQAASTLNPYLSGGWKDRDAGSVILEPLAEFDDQGVLVPALATEIPTVANGGVAEDLKSITWQLLEGVLWSDGTPLTSDDVVFSWEYCSHPDTGCANAGSYEGVTSVEAVDDLTITVNFAEATPFPYVPFVSNSLPVIQRAQFGNCVGAASAECTDQNFAPIGTGPFKIESFTTNDTAVYVINENYRGVPEGEPYFGRVVIKGGGDAPATARSVLELGESDYAWNLQVEPEILAAMVAAGKGTVVSAFSTMVERIMVNQTNPDPALGDDRSEYMDGGNPHPFLTDPVVGRALSIAIDRQTLVDVGYGDAGRPTCNVWPAPPAQNSTANDECLTQDIDLANQLLDDAGYADTDGDGVRESPDGVPLKILYQTSTNTVRQATQELIKQDWAKIGVETELRNIDASVFFGGDPASPDTYGKFYADIEMYTNGAAGVDSQSYMGSWTTPNISGKDTNWQGSNVQRFQSDEYDTLHAELTQTADMDRRNEITIQLNDLVVGNYSIIPLIHRGSVSAHANSLTGVKLNPWDAELWNIGEWARN